MYQHLIVLRHLCSFTDGEGGFVCQLSIGQRSSTHG